MNKIFEDMDKDLTDFLDAVLPLSKRQPKVFEKKRAITKEKKLLVFILNVQTSGHRFNLDEYSDNVIGYGITKNRNSLNAMLNTLRDKQLIRSFFPGRWCLTKSGKDEAEFWFKKLEDETKMTATPSTSQEQEIEKLKREVVYLRNQNEILRNKNKSLKNRYDCLKNYVNAQIYAMQVDRTIKDAGYWKR